MIPCSQGACELHKASPPFPLNVWAVRLIRFWFLGTFIQQICELLLYARTARNTQTNIPALGGVGGDREQKNNAQ